MLQYIPLLSFAFKAWSVLAARLVPQIRRRLPDVRITLVPTGLQRNPEPYVITCDDGRIDIEVRAWLLFDSRETDDVVFYHTELDVWKRWQRWRPSQHFCLTARTAEIPGDDQHPRTIELGLTIPKQGRFECGVSYKATLEDRKFPSALYEARLIFRFKRFSTVWLPLILDWYDAVRLGARYQLTGRRC